jgi:hypothetical protein
MRFGDQRMGIARVAVAEKSLSAGDARAGSPPLRGTCLVVINMAVDAAKALP